MLTKKKKKNFPVNDFFFTSMVYLRINLYTACVELTSKIIYKISHLTICFFRYKIWTLTWTWHQLSSSVVVSPSPLTQSPSPSGKSPSPLGVSQSPLDQNNKGRVRVRVHQTRVPNPSPSPAKIRVSPHLSPNSAYTGLMSPTVKKALF